MLKQIEDALSKDITYIDLGLRNGDTYNIYQPNQNKGNDIEILSDSDILKWTQIYDNGCTYENYVRNDDIVSLTIICNCPSLLEDDNTDTEDSDIDV